VEKGEAGSAARLGWGASVRSIFVGKHDGEAGLAVVVGAAYRFEADPRRGALTVIVANVQGERKHAPAATQAEAWYRALHQARSLGQSVFP
jgi:hypothetical protein